MLISMGIDIESISLALGHSKRSTTYDIYGHEIEEYRARISQAMGSQLPYKPKIA